MLRTNIVKLSAQKKNYFIIILLPYDLARLKMIIQHIQIQIEV